MKNKTGFKLYIEAFIWALKCIFKSCLVSSILRIIIDIIIALIPATSISLISHMVEEAGKAYFKVDNNLIYYVTAYFGIIIAKSFFALLGPVMNLHIKRSLKLVYDKQIISAYNDIDYETMQSEKCQNLFLRIGGNLSDKIFNCFFGGISIAQGIISSLSIFYVLRNLSIIYVLFLIAIAAIQFALTLKFQDSYFETNEKYESLKRKSGYYASVLWNPQYSKEIKLFGSFGYLLNKWLLTDTELENSNYRLSEKSDKIQAINITLSAFLIGALTIGCLISIRKGTLVQGDFVAAVLGFSSLIEFVALNIKGGVEYIKSNAYAYSGYLEFLKLKNAYLTQTLATYPNGIRHTIVFENVWFRYSDSEEYVLRNINLQIEIGKSISIVGRNGCGKTTFANLMMGFLKPTKGKIYYDGIDAQTIPANERMKLFAVVKQNFQKYEMSLHDNISIGLPEKYDCPLEEEYLDTLGITTIASRGENGYDMQLGRIKKGAVNLSEGEWQKVAIARALYSHKDILVMDEPTSALDPNMETELYQFLFEITNQKNKTLFLISHRLGSTKITDMILLLENGLIEEKGTFEELMNRRGKYYEMYTTQADWYKEGKNSEAQ